MEQITNVSFFKHGITQKENPVNQPIEEILTGIKNGDWKNELNYYRSLLSKHGKKNEIVENQKRRLPYFTVSGVFTIREDKGLLKHSGLIQIDIDNLAPSNLIPLRTKLENDVHVFASFISPSLDGLKLIVKIPTIDHKASFRALEKYFRDKYSVPIDPTAKNVSRAFFVSYDSNLYYNPDSDIFF